MLAQLPLFSEAILPPPATRRKRRAPTRAGTAVKRRAVGDKAANGPEKPRADSVLTPSPSHLDASQSAAVNGSTSVATQWAPSAALAPAASSSSDSCASVPGVNAAPNLGTHGLTDEQLAVVVADAQGVVVVAPAGAGKTRVVAERVAHCVREGVPPRTIVVFCATDVACRRLRAAVAFAIGEDAAAAVRCTTLDAFALDLLRTHAGDSHLPANARIIDEASRATLLAAALDIKERAARQLLAEISTCKRRRQPPAEGSKVDQAFVAYARQLAARGMIDHDDLLVRAAQLLEETPDVRASTQRGIRHVLIDDAHDLDDAATRFVRLLCGPAAHLVALGDPEAVADAAAARIAEEGSIRGGSFAPPAGLARLCAVFPEAEREVWRTVHRCGPTLLRARRDMMASPPDAQGRAQHAPYTRPAGGTLAVFAPRRSGDDILCSHVAANEHAEALFVARSIAAQVSAKSAPDEAPVLTRTYADFAVLYRSHAQEGVLHAALLRAGIPVQRRAHCRLSEDAAVQRLVRAMHRLRGSAGPLTERLSVAVQRVQLATPVRYREHLARAFAALEPLAHAYGEDAEAFLQALPLLRAIDTWDPAADAVALLHVEAARGLEFAVVFLPGLEENIYPAGAGPWSKARLAQEKRLLHLGMSRARERLVVSRARQRNWRARLRRRLPSVFLAELPPSSWVPASLPPHPRSKASSAVSQLALL